MEWLHITSVGGNFEYCLNWWLGTWFHVVNILNTTQAGSLKQEYTIFNEMVENMHEKDEILRHRCPKSAKNGTQNGSHFEFLINTWSYHIYNIPIGISHKYMKLSHLWYSYWIQWPWQCRCRHQICVSRTTTARDMSNSIFGGFWWRPFWKVPKMVGAAQLIRR